MSTLGLGMGNTENGGQGTQSSALNHTLIAQRMQAESSLKSGASWFVWIAGLSVVNTISAYSGGGWAFSAGLGITQLVDAIARPLGSAGLVVGLFINVMAVGFFALLFAFARKAQRWAFITGLIFYGLDTLLLLFIALSGGGPMIFGLVIHGLGLFGMVRGLKASGELKAIAESEQRAAVGATAGTIG